MKEFDLLNAPLEGATLIEASAGTGKTHTISGVFLRLLLEKGLSVDEILVVTFTNAATEELRDRIRSMLKEALAVIVDSKDSTPDLCSLLAKFPDKSDVCRRLRSALRNFDEAAIYTIHGFCQRILHENAFESDALFDTELVTEQNSLMQETIDDFWRIYLCNDTPLFVNYVKNKYNPDKLLRCYNNYNRTPDLKIIPAIDIPDTAQLEKEYYNSLTDLQKVWRDDYDIVIDFLYNYKGLNRRKYQKRTVKNLLYGLDIFIKSNGGTPLFKNYNRLTEGEIEESLKPGYQLPGTQFFYHCEEFFRIYEKLYQVFADKLIALEIKLFKFLKRELERKKQKLNIHHYDDLINKLYWVLESENSHNLIKTVRKQFKAALIDEFQDTDPSQYYIFSKLFNIPGYALYLIGDPKQAIYSFRGADIFTFIKASRQIKNKLTLYNNWRSDHDLIEAINTIFSSIEDPFLFRDIPFAPATFAADSNRDIFKIAKKSSPPFQFWFVNSNKFKDAVTRDGYIKISDVNRIISRAVASEISELLNTAEKNITTIHERPLEAGDIAILIRFNKEAHPVQKALAALGIPSVFYSDADLFKSHEALELERVLTAIACPDDEGLLKAALTTDMVGLTGEQIFKQYYDDEPAYENWLIKFRDYNRIWKQHGFFNMIWEFIASENVRTRLLAFQNGERRLTNLLHLAEVLNEESFDNNSGITGLLRWLSSQTGENVINPKKCEIRLESDENAVKIVTIHKSKGLEYPVVFCPFTWNSSKIRSSDDNVFHDETDDFRPTLDLSPLDLSTNKIAAEKEKLAENLRLMYVALTRAKCRVYQVWGKFNKSETSAAARFLIGKELEDPTDPVAELEQKFKEFTDDDIYARIENIKGDTDNIFTLEDIPHQPGKIYKRSPSEQKKLKCRKFSGNIDRSWKIASFSYLISGMSFSSELPDHDSLEAYSENEAAADEKNTGRSIFTFPRGTVAGTLIHEILESSDFTCDDPDLLQELVKTKLTEYNFELSWNDAVCEMINKTLSTNLSYDEENFSLSQVETINRLNELEFYFPLKTITPDKINKIFKKYKISDQLSLTDQTWGRLQFSPLKGFMKGFIDLVFEHNNKYYLVDWKSNYLGSKIDDYSPEKLAFEMQSRFYFLQYHIYLVALNRYLSLRIPGYDYNSHFGGVYYLFLRAIDPAQGNKYGIYYNFPSGEFINELTDLLLARQEKY